MENNVATTAHSVAKEIDIKSDMPHRRYDLIRLREMAQSDEFSDDESDGEAEEEQEEVEVDEMLLVPFIRYTQHPATRPVVSKAPAPTTPNHPHPSPQTDEWTFVDKSPTFERFHQRYVNDQTSHNWFMKQTRS